MRSIVPPAFAQENVKLKHNQRLVFTDASVGTHFEAVETGVTNYTPTLNVMIDNTTITDADYTGTIGSGMDTKELIVAEDQENSSAFTNTYIDVTPTGIIMNNLPFFILIVIAVGALVVFAIVKRRRKAGHCSKH